MIKYIIILILIVSPASAVKIVGGTEEQRYIVENVLEQTERYIVDNISTISITNISDNGMCEAHKKDNILEYIDIYLNESMYKELFIYVSFHEIGHVKYIIDEDNYGERVAITYSVNKSILFEINCLFFEINCLINEMLNKDR